MRRPVVRFARMAILLILAGLFGVSYYQGPARAAHPSGISTASATTESTDALVWQGKVLPIVTDAYASIGDLLNTLQNRDVDGVAKAGVAFGGEQQRFERISPTPKPVRTASKLMDNALRNMNFGTQALVVGLRASDNAGAQRAAQQIQQGLRQFQQAVDRIRRLSGPIGQPTPLPGSGTPVPTPVIPGLP